MTTIANAWRSFRKWVVTTDPNGLGSLASGVGTVLLGFAALIALCQTRDLLSEVLKIQKQADSIRAAVGLLHAEMLRFDSQRGVEQAKTREGQPVTDSDKLREILQRQFPAKPLPSRGWPIFLPESGLQKVINAWAKETDPVARGQVLQKELLVGPPENQPAP
jgi:hypothetical protein